MRTLTFFAVAALACLACAVQANAEGEDLAVVASNDAAPPTPNEAAPMRQVVTTHLNMEAAQ